jgi:hypothetical protein
MPRARPLTIILPSEALKDPLSAACVHEQYNNGTMAGGNIIVPVHSNDKKYTKLWHLFTYMSSACPHLSTHPTPPVGRHGPQWICNTHTCCGNNSISMHTHCDDPAARCSPLAEKLSSRVFTMDGSKIATAHKHSLLQMRGHFAPSNITAQVRDFGRIFMGKMKAWPINEGAYVASGLPSAPRTLVAAPRMEDRWQ